MNYPKTIIYTDGSGQSPYSNGYFAWYENGRFYCIESRTPLTNNEAEYTAICHALRERFQHQEITIFSDSQLIINQLNGKYKIKDKDLKYLYEAVMGYVMLYELHITFRWCPREENVAGIMLEKAIKANKTKQIKDSDNRAQNTKREINNEK